MTLGEKICRLRTEKEMSQGELADALEVSRQSVSKWETNTSVPELSKLVKLSELFEISLDELVIGKEAPEEPKQNTKEPSSSPSKEGPQIIYLEKPILPRIHGPQILGVILLVCAVLCFLTSDDYYDALLISLPLIITGALCLVTKHPILWFIWCCIGAWWYYLFMLSMRWEESGLLLILGVLLVLAALIYTILQHRKGKIHIPVWGWTILILLLSLGAVLLTINLIPPSLFTNEISTPVIPIIDASVCPE